MIFGSSAPRTEKADTEVNTVPDPGLFQEKNRWKSSGFFLTNPIRCIVRNDQRGIFR